MSVETNSTEELKELGNAAVKNQKYEEAVLHYTHAIKLDQTNFTLYSNRSLAFLKMQQFYYAMQDADETIKLNPTWPKGYFRKGEVEFATYHFVDAYSSYEKALQLKPDDNNIMDAMAKTSRENQKDKKADEQIPWLGAGVGIVIGVILVIADFVYTNKPTHPILMAVVTISIAMVGYGLAKAFRYYVKCQRDSLLDPPVNLIEDEDKDKLQNETKQHNTTRYTKSQARQRYKKGKM